MLYPNPTDFLSQEAYDEAMDEVLFGGVASPSDARREYATNAGSEDRGRQWILTPWDTWEQNPYYSGPPQRHPEEDPEDYGDEVSLTQEAYYPRLALPGFESDESYDEIPF